MPAATRVESDGTVELTWEAAPGDGPIEYEITASPAAGGPVVTSELSHTFTGLENGVAYTFTIVPRNEHGRGEPFEITATPGTRPTITNALAERTGDRRFRVTFDLDDGGRRIETCTIVTAGTTVTCDASGASVSATVDVPQYNTAYTFTIEVESSEGTAGATASGRSNGKPLVVEAETARWDGACTWPGHERKRPRYETPKHHCTIALEWIDRGTTVRGLCHTRGERIQDDYLNPSDRWIRVDRGGYMSTLYFENYANTQAVIDGLPAC